MAKRSEPGKQKRILTSSQSSWQHTAWKRTVFSEWEGFTVSGVFGKDMAQGMLSSFSSCSFPLSPPSCSSLDVSKIKKSFLGWQLWQVLFFLSARRLFFSSFNSPSPEKIEWEIAGQTLLSATGMIELWMGNSRSDEPNAFVQTEFRSQLSVCVPALDQLCNYGHLCHLQ